MRTKEKLARALEEYADRTGDMRVSDMAGRARDGYYDEYESDLGLPLIQLMEHARIVGLPELAQRVIDGEFDATPEEHEAWGTSTEGRKELAEFAAGLVGQGKQPQGPNRAARRGNRQQGRRRRGRR